LTTYQATCVPCGQNPYPTTPSQISLAIGAAGVQFVPRTLALASDLSKAKGLRGEKSAPHCPDCSCSQLTAGGLSQALDRVATKVKPQNDAIATELRGPGCPWLRDELVALVFTRRQATLYVIHQTRGRCVITELLGTEFAAVVPATFWLLAMRQPRCNRIATPIILLSHR
jgi:hypothetical protein